MGNADPNNTKAGKEIQGQDSVRRAIKTSNHATCCNQCYAMHEGYQGSDDTLENHLNQPLYQHGVSTREIIGTTHLSASHNVALNQVINQSVNQDQDTSIQEESYDRNQLFLSTKSAATNRRCISLHAPKRRRSVPTADDRFLPKQRTADILLLTQSVTTQNDVASGTRHPRCQQLIKPTSGHTNNSNDDIRDTSPSLPTAGHKALHPKRCVPTYQNDVALPSAASHSKQQLVA
ncbi:hypothetical protein F511_07627 [Dorcoceras hygrometricum]|uniref:Uncharacterized protein n=1 Tax=Dorcoceras hygrometricum TaxID=472368 RepID=A0A2Z7CXE0_9LAMI|nr:hypothetical protein F511_07627 [Dorcoceras hygrometricum]